MKCWLFRTALILLIHTLRDMLETSEEPARRMKGVCVWEDANDGVLSVSRPERGLPACQSDGTTARERGYDGAYGQNVLTFVKSEHFFIIFTNCCVTLRSHASLVCWFHTVALNSLRVGR